jgi:DNA-binding MarR family transcriptional regulator
MKRDEEASAPLGIEDALAQLSFLVHGVVGKIGAEHDLSVIQARLLGILRDRSPGMNELARYLELDKSSITGLVDRAERRGLVRREPSRSDGRAVDVVITPAGRKLVSRLQAEFEKKIAVLVGVLTPAERASLSRLASRIVARD